MGNRSKKFQRNKLSVKQTNKRIIAEWLIQCQNWNSSSRHVQVCKSKQIDLFQRNRQQCFDKKFHYKTIANQYKRLSPIKWLPKLNTFQQNFSSSSFRYSEIQNRMTWPRYKRANVDNSDQTRYRGGSESELPWAVWALGFKIHSDLFQRTRQQCLFRQDVPRPGCCQWTADK